MWRATFLITPMFLVLACGGGDDNGGDELSIAQWAAEYCVAAERLTDIGDVGAGVDATTLSLEERKERSPALISELTEIFDDARSTLLAIDPPPSVRDAHEARISQIDSLLEALGVQADRIALAESPQDIEAANAELNIVLEQTGAEIDEAVEDLPEEAGAALRGVNNCG